MTTSRAKSTNNLFYGVVTGEVVDNKDEREKEGRIKVKFAWFNGEMVTEWCRVSQFYAGDGYGAFFVPEEMDEVLIAFEHGDMRRPIILGGLYNGKDKPATHRAGNKDEKLIRTKSGHQFCLDDTQGEEKIVIIDSGGENSIVISTKDNNITIESKSGKLILSGKGVEIKSTEGMVVEATRSVDIKGQKVNIN